MKKAKGIYVKNEWITRRSWTAKIWLDDPMPWTFFEALRKTRKEAISECEKAAKKLGWKIIEWGKR